MSHAHTDTAAAQGEGRLRLVLVLTSAVMLVEATGGVWAHSLALLADAGHMLADVAGLALALVAIRFARRPATPEHTYGYHRVEILAALTNAVVLVGIAVLVLVEAWYRFRHPQPVASGTMLAVAVVGLAVNLAGMLLMRRGAAESLNLKGVYYELLSDLLASLGVIVAALVIAATGWTRADPLISAAIGLFIIPRTWALLRGAVGILLEGTPADVNLAAVRQALAEEPCIATVHDLHVWTLTSGVNAMSVHVVRADGATNDQVLDLVHRKLKAGFKVAHVTVQVESRGCAAGETHL